jgi:hypothetical protein
MICPSCTPRCCRCDSLAPQLLTDTSYQGSKLLLISTNNSYTEMVVIALFDVVLVAP